MPITLEPPSTPPEVLQAEPEEDQHEECRNALARLALLIDQGAHPALVVRWAEHRLAPLGVRDYEAALTEAQAAFWWRRTYRRWASRAAGRLRRRLVDYAWCLEQRSRPGNEAFIELARTQRAMLQDIGVLDPDAALAEARQEPWWACAYAVKRDSMTGGLTRKSPGPPGGAQEAKRRT